MCVLYAGVDSVASHTESRLSLSLSLLGVVVKLGRQGRLVENAHNIKQLIHDTNHDNNGQIKGCFIRRGKEGKNLTQSIQHLETRSTVHTHTTTVVWIGTRLPRGGRVLFVNGRAHKVAVGHNIIKELKGPVQIFQGNQETTKQKGGKPKTIQSS